MRQRFQISTLLALSGLSMLACSGAEEALPEPGEEAGVGGASTGGQTQGTGGETQQGTGGADSSSGGADSSSGGATTASGGSESASGGNTGAAPSCSDGIENQDETGVDCGGVCTACSVAPTCSDGIENQDETGVDCGGVCDACSSPVYSLPTANAQFDYQIGGAYTPPSGVQVVSRDREASPAPGMYNICYVNGFQIQPGEETWWENNHPDLILKDASGDPIIDGGWDEMLVDVSTAAKRASAAAVVGEWIEQCAADGYDAVEIDNLDSHSRSEGELAQSDNVAFMGMLADIAHANGLAAAQKNSTEFLDDVDEMHTDFAIAEECNEWNECGDYQSVYGNLVFVIEYDSDAFDDGCSDFPELSIVLRDMSVSASGTYDAC